MGFFTGITLIFIGYVIGSFWPNKEFFVDKWNQLKDKIED
jgi:hypothetical protein